MGERVIRNPQVRPPIRLEKWSRFRPSSYRPKECFPCYLPILASSRKTTLSTWPARPPAASIRSICTGRRAITGKSSTTTIFSIDGDGTIYAACRSLLEKKCHTWRRNSRSIGIALCGAYGARVTLPTCEIGAGVSALSRAEQVMPHIPHIVEYGPEPPLPLQTEVMARLVAILCRHLNLPIEPATVQTHCEAAIRDGYGPCSDDPELRWDLWFLPNADPSAAASGTPEEAKAREWQALSVTVADAEEAARLVAELPITRGGDLVRGKARWYRAHTWLN